MNIKPAALLLTLDALWIGGYMGKKYNEMIPRIQNELMDVKPVYAIFAYALMILGLYQFVLPNIRKTSKLHDSIKYGFLFGIIVYGIYDFTCAAVFKKWDNKLAFIDMLWGGFLFSIVAYLGT